MENGHTLQPIRIRTRTAIGVARTFAVLYGPAHSEMRPWVAIEVFHVKVLVTGPVYHLHIMHTGTRPDSIDASRVIILVPAPTVMLPDSVLDPFLSKRLARPRVA